MGCGSSQEAVVQPNSHANGNVVKSDPESVPSDSPNNKHEVAKQEDGKPRSRNSSASSKRSRKSSSSSSSSGSSRSVKNDDNKKEKQTDQVDGEKVTATSTKQNEIPQETTQNQEELTATEAQEKPNFDQEVLQQFIHLESQIKELGNKDRESIRFAEYNRLLELHKALVAQGEKVEELKAKTVKEYQDIVQVNQPSVRALFINQNQHDAQLQKETQEYLDALNEQEVAQQELESMKEKYKNMYLSYNSSAEMQKEEKQLRELQYEQEKILGQVFNDSYGSDKEWKLEMEFDLLAEKKERIQGAHVKWSNAQKFMRTATGQINWAARRWAQIMTHNVQAQMARYQMSAETRNYLIAASQNIQSTHNFLNPIKVPYYTTEDLQRLHSLINTIFHDVQVPKRYQESYTSFVEDYNKCQNLLNWIDQVLSATITKDLNEVKKAFHEKYYELKEERMTLIQAKIKEKLGVEMSLEFKKEEYKEDTTGDNEGEAVVQPGSVNKEEGDGQAPEAEAESNEPPAEMLQTLAPTEEESTETPAAGEGEDKPVEESKPKVKAVPLTELAPAPNQEELFGDIEQLKKKHEEEIAEFEKAQEINKARVDQGLQEKLRARRSRKRKIQKQQDEALALGGESGNSLPPPPE